MTEREKMLAGELYDCSDPELLAQSQGSGAGLQPDRLRGAGGEGPDFDSAAGKARCKPVDNAAVFCGLWR